MNGKLPKESLFNDPDFIFWEETWKNRLKKNNHPEEKSYDLMKSSNPVLIPRNHLVEKVLSGEKRLGHNIPNELKVGAMLETPSLAYAPED